MLREILKIREKKIGQSPGTLIHVGEKKSEEVKLNYIEYNHENLKIQELSDRGKSLDFRARPGIFWLNIYGLHDITLLENLREQFDIDPLIMEDILNTSHQPKIEVHENYIFIIAKMITFKTDENQAEFEQFSLIAGKNYVLSFQEKEGDIFDPIRQRLKNTSGRLRKNGADYLLYALLDVIVDNYYMVLQQVGDNIESLDEAVINYPDKKIVFDILNLKRTILLLRRSIWPLRQAIHDLRNEDTVLISDFVNPYLRDLYDHALQVTETIEIFRDMIAGTMDSYQSMLSNRMNDVMRILTIIATIFIPLTFIAGIYGMNFENMPELKWPLGYTLIWGIMILVGVIMIIFFRKKKWL